MAGRYALLLATGKYEDASLPRLSSPAGDAAALAGLLSDPEIGRFEVRTLIDRPVAEMRLAAERFFRDRARDDVLLLHVSGHGVLHEFDGRHLFFAATDTRDPLLDSTALDSRTVMRQLDRSRAGTVIGMIDCCYSGAVAAGAKSGAGARPSFEVEGSGRAVFCAAGRTALAYEGASGSAFTQCVVEGLRSGAADLDQDGWVSLDDLRRYLDAESAGFERPQRPELHVIRVSGDVRIAAAPGSSGHVAALRLAEQVRRTDQEFGGLPGPVVQALGDSHPEVRRFGIDQLHHYLLRAADPENRDLALERLGRMLDDPDDAVAQHARSLLADAIGDEPDSTAPATDEDLRAAAAEQASAITAQWADAGTPEQVALAGQLRPYFGATGTPYSNVSQILDIVRPKMDDREQQLARLRTKLAAGDEPDNAEMVRYQALMTEQNQLFQFAQSCFTSEHERIKGWSEALGRT